MSRAIPMAAIPMAVLALALLSGCSAIGEQLGSSVWVTPGKYQYHSCIQLKQADAGQAYRQKQLEELMERAAKGTGGQVIGTVVYRSDYQQALGERQELAKVMTEKRCQVESPRSSERQVF